MCMRGMLFLFLVLAASGCLMKPYSGGLSAVNNTNNTTVEPVAPPVQRTCLGPVCGADDQTYETDCEAYDARIAILYTGECRSPEPSCNDSDDGLKTDVAGAVTKGNETHADYCLDPSQLVEYGCLDNATTMATIQCGEGKGCKDGQCMVKNESAQNVSLVCAGLSEPDIYLKQNVTWNGTIYYDVCVDYKSVKDYFCQDQGLASINHECPPGYGCTGGMCTQALMTCIESDAGNDTSVRGKTTVTRGLGTLSEDWDICVDVQSIREYYCLENGTSAYSEFSCGSGKKCMDGRCVKSQCTETDAWRDIYHAGTTHDSSGTYEDNCNGDTVVREYYCYGDTMNSVDLECARGYVCDGGECIRD